MMDITLNHNVGAALPFPESLMRGIGRGIRMLLALFSGSEERRERERTFVRITEEYNSIISGICFSYATDPDDLKDLRQDIMINIWKGLQSYRGESSLSTWIYRVALNTCVSTVRKRSHRPVTVPIETRTEEQSSEADDALRDKIAYLHSVIATLSSLDKAVITMWLDECKYEEIAEVTGISRSNVAVRINRIKQKLSDKMVM